MASDKDIPESFVPIRRSSPFLDSIGPLYEKVTPQDIVLGLRIEPRHANNRAFAHGGLLFTLADLVLGMNVAAKAGEGHGLTVNISIDFVRPIRVGQWVEARAEVQHAGGTLGFANCYLTVDGQRMTRASAVFKMAT
jgi:uncharacterized protein (TIGR00369 family)